MDEGKHETTPASKRPAHNARDLTDQRFTKLVVQSRAPTHYTPSGQAKSRWNCRCDCGQVVVVIGQDLRRGHTTSCGCEQRRIVTRHGRSSTAACQAWYQMIARCYRDKHAAYRYYGARGIGVCKRWREDVVAFVDDMGPKPSRRHSLDRIDNDGGYWCGACPECVAAGRPPNCRWATPTQQQGNKSSSLRYEFRGETVSLADLARLAPHITRNALLYRLSQGMTPEEAIARPRYDAYTRRGGA